MAVVYYRLFIGVYQQVVRASRQHISYRVRVARTNCSYGVKCAMDQARKGKRKTVYFMTVFRVYFFSKKTFYFHDRFMGIENKIIFPHHSRGKENKTVCILPLQMEGKICFKHLKLTIISNREISKQQVYRLHADLV